MQCSNGACVEVVYQGQRVLVRDSKLAKSPVIEFDHAGWVEFLETVRQDCVPDGAIELIDGGVWLPVDGWWLKFDGEEWDSFVEGVKAGRFDVEVKT